MVVESKDFSLAIFFFVIFTFIDSLNVWALKLLQEDFSSSALGQTAAAKKLNCPVNPILMQWEFELKASRIRVDLQ